MSSENATVALKRHCVLKFCGRHSWIFAHQITLSLAGSTRVMLLGQRDKMTSLILTSIFPDANRIPYWSDEVVSEAHLELFWSLGMSHYVVD